MTTSSNRLLRASAALPANGERWRRRMPMGMLGLLVALSSGSSGAAEGNAKRGAIAFRSCISCHSLEPGRHLTGPSLAGLFGRKAGAASGFQRYSDAMKKSDVAWNEKNLDEWLANPVRLIPGNTMVFPGMPDSQTRRDLVTYLKAVEDGNAQRAGMRLPRLKSAPAQDIIKTVRHCGDTYFLTTESGRELKIWEFNLRLKVDSSEFGPHPGRPVIVGMGMRGDRLAIVFSRLAEIGAMVREQCG